MLTEDKITEIFVMADEFCKVFDAMLHRRGHSAPRKDRNSANCSLTAYS